MRLGTVDVAYDDGFKENRVDATQVRYIKETRPSQNIPDVGVNYVSGGRLTSNAGFRRTGRGQAYWQSKISQKMFGFRPGQCLFLSRCAFPENF